jgi:signal transduction histidine kinase
VSDRPRTLVTVTVGALVAVTCALLVVMFVARPSERSAAIATAIALVTTSLVGAVVAHRRPEHPCGWLLAGLALFVAIAGASLDYVDGSLARDERYPFTTAVGWITTWAGFPALALGTLLLLTFPTGHFTSPRWRAAGVATVVSSVVVGAAGALMPGPLPAAAAIDNPLGISGADGVLEAVSSLATTVAAAVLAAAVVRLVLRHRRAGGIEREQLRMLARALPVTAAGLLFAMVASGPLNDASFYFAVLGLTAVPVAIGWAVLRHRLFDLDVLVNRALVYGLLTLVVGGLYVAVVAALGRALNQPVDIGVSVVATAVVAVAFGPLRQGLQHVVDRAMYGARSDPLAALSSLTRRLEAVAAPEAALPSTAETVGQSLKLAWVEIRALRDGQLVAAATWGDAGGAGGVEVLSLVHGRELVGQLAIAARSGEALSARDRRLLAELCGPAALVVHVDTVRTQLQASRQQLVAATEQERRRLRADLHDGLGPELAGVVFGLGAARNRLHADPGSVDALLAQLQAQVRGTVKQVRTLVDGLVPSVEQLGLSGAIRDGARRLAASTPVAVTVDVPDDLPPLPAAVEVAAYRITMEALTNVVRHADATSCTVRLRAADGVGVGVEVVDDGVGLPATLVPGVGLSSMRQRAEEIGGTWTIEPADHGRGTRVSARLPVR